MNLVGSLMRLHAAIDVNLMKTTTVEAVLTPAKLLIFDETL